MTYKVAFASQAGNPGKSALAVSLAVEASNNGLSTKLIDLDSEHRTTERWHTQRATLNLDPLPELASVKSAESATRESDGYDGLVIFDCPSRATTATAVLAKQSDLVVVPVGPGKKDADLALGAIAQWHATEQIPLKRFLLLLTRQLSDSEIRKWRAYLTKASINSQSVNVLTQALADKLSYRQACETGYALTETMYASLNDRAKRLFAKIMAEVVK